MASFAWHIVSNLYQPRSADMSLKNLYTHRELSPTRWAGDPFVDIISSTTSQSNHTNGPQRIDIGVQFNVRNQKSNTSRAVSPGSRAFGSKGRPRARTLPEPCSDTDAPPSSPFCFADLIALDSSAVIMKAACSSSLGHIIGSVIQAVTRFMVKFFLSSSSCPATQNQGEGAHCRLQTVLQITPES